MKYDIPFVAARLGWLLMALGSGFMAGCSTYIASHSSDTVVSTIVWAVTFVFIVGACEFSRRVGTWSTP